MIRACLALGVLLGFAALLGLALRAAAPTKTLREACLVMPKGHEITVRVSSYWVYGQGGLLAGGGGTCVVLYGPEPGVPHFEERTGEFCGQSLGISWGACDASS